MKYLINIQSYYSNTNNNIIGQDKGFVSKKNILLTEKAMKGLIERYSIKNKSILSLGSGEAFEEYWFYQYGCNLVLNDIDSSGKIEAHLQSIKHKDIKNSLTYYICDALEMIEDNYDSNFDILYVSSFHPDEIRREEIQKNFYNKSSYFRKIISRYLCNTWPVNKEPYLDTLVKALNLLKKDGLAIFQHYRGGVDLLWNPHYFELAKKQFRKYGCEILEIYTFKKSTVHLLMILYCGNKKDAKNYAKTLKFKNKIKTFHGRYPYKSINTNTVRIFNILNPIPFKLKVLFTPIRFENYIFNLIKNIINKYTKLKKEIRTSIFIRSKKR